MHKLFIAALAALALAAGVLAAVAPAAATEPVRRGKIAAPDQGWRPQVIQPPPAEAVRSPHIWYFGGVVAYHAGLVEREHQGEKPYSFLDGTESLSGGGLVGYLYKNGAIGYGVEADYVFRDLGDFNYRDGIASLRGRLGMFLGDGSAFLYGTAGVGEHTGNSLPSDLRRGLVVGGGFEKDIASGLALRLEGLHYRLTDNHFEWGRESDTAARFAVIAKF